jgi:hypothetical protein
VLAEFRLGAIEPADFPDATAYRAQVDPRPDIFLDSHTNLNSKILIVIVVHQ